VGRDEMPSDVNGRIGWFDRFAESAAKVVSRAWFFAACVVMVVVWAPSYLLIRNLDTYQLLINTSTTIVTFLLVALLQNSQRRDGQASQHKLNAIAAGVAELLRARSSLDEPGEAAAVRAASARRELLAAVGLEDRESA
jgi:hypothetical protein